MTPIARSYERCKSVQERERKEAFLNDSRFPLTYGVWFSLYCMELVEELPTNLKRFVGSECGVSIGSSQDYFRKYLSVSRRNEIFYSFLRSLDLTVLDEIICEDCSYPERKYDTGYKVILDCDCLPF